MQFQLITPEKVFFSGDVKEVTVPGGEGEFGALEGHEATIATLKPGVVTIHTSEGQTHKIAVLGGVSEALAERASVLAEVALSLDGKTKEDLSKELDEAENRLKMTVAEADRPAAQRRVELLEAAIA